MLNYVFLEGDSKLVIDTLINSSARWDLIFVHRRVNVLAYNLAC
jgi:hypothetical protein